ncbi:MAG: M20/M25/M40 family metallo-hydrolase [Gemmatimonadota bacterium]|nr:M20/M25/M40 family metallo-hydrolase [Gemmatimonadota bacterium]
MTLRFARAAAVLPAAALALLPLARTPLAAQAWADRFSATPYRDAANRLIDAALADSAAYARLTELGDRFGHRLSGSASLERALDWILEEMEADGLENVRGEPVLVPHWVRGEESARMIVPFERDLPMLGLGGSIGTPKGGIRAQVMVVESFEELERRADEAKGRIVLFAPEWVDYGTTGAYRRQGAIAAGRAGAVASLIRSVTPYSQQTPHTGNMQYADGVPRIPHAALTVEDAELIKRMVRRGERVEVHLEMDAQTLPDTWSRNVVAEIRGRELPDEVIVLGGHIDSWDVGQGMMDDGGGSVAAWEAVRLMKALDLRPRRTVRVVLWTNEENGTRGGNGYRDAHMDELDDHILAMESDGGVFKPEGFGFTGSDAAFSVLQEVGSLLDRIEAGAVTRGGGGADIAPIMALGVPGMGLNVDGTRYFWYHHTDADTIDKLDPHEVALCVAAMAVHAYVVAEMPERLPR